MKIIIDDDTMRACATGIAADGRKISATFEVFEDDTVEELISRAIDKLSAVYLDMCSPYM